MGYGERYPIIAGGPGPPAINIYPEFLCPSPSQPKLNTESLPSSILESPPTVTHKILNQSAQEEPRQSAAVKFALELTGRALGLGTLGSENGLGK